MKLKLVLSTIIGLTCAATIAEARNDWHLYGAVQVAGDRVLETAYRNALYQCGYDGYPSNTRIGAYHIPNGSPEMRICLSRMGFILEYGEPFAYPVRKVVYHSTY
ncbi:hypothetical protein [Agrobacterium sp. NPDC090273]|uniref:hypothetical protein n=1 Tax=Agrobacterium sp. NPDC090273 TaxID=3363919 RepID=UPI00383B496A